jgi:hypothetical protein
MPGPHQWEATFSRTSYRFTTQAVKTVALQKGGYNLFRMSANRNKTTNQGFFLKKIFFFSYCIFAFLIFCCAFFLKKRLIIPIRTPSGRKTSTRQRKTPYAII